MNERYVFAPDSGESYVTLSRSPSGRVVKKHILSTGTLHYPGVKDGKVEITGETLDSIVANFSNKVCDIVQFPLVTDSNAHSEDPLRNAGEVVRLQHEGDKLYAYIDVRKEEALAAIKEKTLIGASAMMSLNYTDTRTGKKVGPTLLHVAGTNRPHVVELEDFELIAASVDSTSKAVLLTASPTKETPTMETLDEILDVLKTDHDIDVRELQAQVAETGSLATLSAKLGEALDKSGIISLSNGDTANAEDLVVAVGQLIDEKTALSGRVEALEQSHARTVAEAEVSALINDGYIPESKRDAYIELRLSNEETFKALVPETPILKLSGEPAGFVPTDESHDDTVTAEIDRYASLQTQ